MNSEDDIWRTIGSLVLTLKRLEEELLEASSLLQEDPLLEYHLLTLEDRVRIIGLLSELSEWCQTISKVCTAIRSRMMSFSQIEHRRAFLAA
jgi:hypothetical protein